MKVQTIARMLRRPELFVQACSRKGWLNWMSDEAYLKLVYRMRMGKKLNLQAPRTFNEKLQWLKLYDRKPHYTELVDKYEVRKHITELLGEEYLIPLLGVWDSAEEIDFESLPQQFVLKCTHDSGSVIICRDKDSFDMKAARAKLTRCLKDNGYAFGREWPYKNVRPRIIAEAFMDDEGAGSGLTDYKFFCFDGKPRMIYVSRGLEDHATASISFYDLKGNDMPFHRSDYKPLSDPLVLPEMFDKMTCIAGELAEMVGCPFVRIDLYSVRGKIYFSEITFSPCGGFLPFEPKEYDEKLGEWITLPEKGDA